MKNAYLKFGLLSILFTLFSCSEEYINHEGTGTLTGKVVSAESNKPMEHVKVETSPITTTVFTDEKGNFIIENIKTGDYSVKTEAKDHITAFKGTVIYQDKTSNVVFELEYADANNKPPTQPLLLEPTDNKILTSTTGVFKWSATDPENDVLTYTLKLYNDQNSDVQIFEDITDTIFEYKNLQLGTKYFWQITVKDPYNTEVISELASFSVYTAPKNNRIVYTKSINGNLVIFSSNQDSTEEFQLTSDKVNSFKPRRNTNSNKIAFLRTNGAQTDVYVMDIDGGNQKKITTNIKPNAFNLNEISISWPLHSERIYFPSFDKLYSIQSNGEGLELVYQTPDNSFISEVDVNLEHNMIALKTNDANGYNVHLFCIDLQKNFLYSVLKDVKGATSGLQLSADGKKVLYSYDITGAQNMNYRRSSARIFLYDHLTATSTEYSTDIDPGTNDLDPRFSPNEAFVIFTNTSNDGLSQKNILIKELSKNLKTRILQFQNAHMPDWN